VYILIAEIELSAELSVSVAPRYQFCETSPCWCFITENIQMSGHLIGSA